MSDLFSKVSELLSDPETARKIQGIASSLSSPQSVEESSEEDSSPAADGGGFSEALASLSNGMTASSHRRETDLLYAVKPYLRPSRAGKIDRALKAIRMIDLLSNLR